MISIYGPLVKWPKTPASHAGNTSSNLVRVTKKHRCPFGMSVFLYLSEYEIRKERSGKARCQVSGGQLTSSVCLRHEYICKASPCFLDFLFCRIYYINICNNTTPQTHGRPNIPLPPTVHQLSGMCTPVNFCVIFIMAIDVNPKRAFKNIDFIILWLLICNISKTKAHIDSQIIAEIPRVFIK